MERLATTSTCNKEPVIDPVCGMELDSQGTDIMTTYQGHDYCFCTEACRREFEAHPERYRKARPDRSKRPKTWWGRYLERVAKANEKLFGGRPSCCH